MKFSLFQNLLPLVLSFGSVSLLLTHYVSAAVQPTCYWEYLDHVDSAGNDGPCAVVNASSGPVSCCSSGDVCMGNNICYGLGGSHLHGSGYYLSGCTDISLQDSSCTSHCVSNGYPDIVYNEKTGLWACCTVINFQVNCSLPTDETFSAPAPSLLTGTFTAHSSTASSTSDYSTTSAASISTTSTPSSAPSASSIMTPVTAAGASQTSTPSPSFTPSNSNPSSIGAKAGIAIGAGIVFVAFLALTIAFIHARRKNRALARDLALQNERSGFKDIMYAYGHGEGSGSVLYSQVNPQEMYGPSPHELHFTQPPPVELSATVNPAELGGWDNYYTGNYRPQKKHNTYYHP